MPFLFQLQFTTYSFFWLLGSLALGIAYAILLYGNPINLKNSYKALLFALRAILITIIAFLLVAPMVKTTNERMEKPLIILALDNSSSILSSKAPNFDVESYLSQIQNLEKKLSTNYDLRTFYFDSSVKNALKPTFDGNQTDISSIFKQINNQFSNRNIGAIILASDGIYNRGGNPQYESQKLPAPIYSIALGDTLPKRDLLVSNVNYNEIAYFGNDFEIEITLEAFLAKGSSSLLTVSAPNGIVYSKPISINSNEFRQSFKVILPATRLGLQTFKIQVSKLNNEWSQDNNLASIFVEVIDAKKQVLILANAPHPDITAIKQSIENSKNYAVKVVLADDFKSVATRDADLVILHQLPSKSNKALDILRQTSNKSRLFILGVQSDIPAFVNAQSVLGIRSNGMMQEALADIKSDFYAFTLSDANKLIIRNFSPLLTPFGTYTLKVPSNVLMNQQIGKTTSDRPLLVFSAENGQRTGILAGEGFWKWRLEDFQENSNHDATNELFQKTVQYLLSNDDKRKFRVYSSKNTFDESETVILNAELYNDAFDLVNSSEVNITLKNNLGKTYSFLFSKTTNSYLLKAGVLPSGTYSYQAKTSLGKNNYQVEGQFIVNSQELELKQSVANHQLLYLMATQNGGKMLFPNQISSIPDLIKANETVKTIVFEDPSYEDLISLKALFFVILSLLTFEWFIRKRNAEFR
jgi:hypothetical protein